MINLIIVILMMLFAYLLLRRLRILVIENFDMIISMFIEIL